MELSTTRYWCRTYFNSVHPRGWEQAVYRFLSAMTIDEGRREAAETRASHFFEMRFSPVGFSSEDGAAYLRSAEKTEEQPCRARESAAVGGAQSGLRVTE